MIQFITADNGIESYSGKSIMLLSINAHYNPANSQGNWSIELSVGRELHILNGIYKGIIGEYGLILYGLIDALQRIDVRGELIIQSNDEAFIRAANWIIHDAGYDVNSEEIDIIGRHMNEWSRLFNAIGDVPVSFQFNDHSLKYAMSRQQIESIKQAFTDAGRQ